MSLPPFDGTGWIAGMPGLPGTLPPPPDPGDLSGWTVAELKTFAEEHDPPIQVPSSANKAQIIELILAALAADEEEN